MGDYTTAHCHLLLGNPTTNIEYINGATMADDLEKYEALAKLLHSKRIAAMHYNQSGITSQVSVPDPDCATAADAITELVAMVREDRADADGMAQMMVAVQERAEAAERDAQEAAANTLHALHQLAELKRKMRDPDGMMLVAMADAALYDSENKIPEAMMKDALLAAVNHLLGDKE